MQNQIEQSCNAEALSQMGVSVIGDFDSRHRQTIAQWMQKGNVPRVNYPDQTAQLIATLVSSEAMQPQTVKQQFGALKSIFKLNWT